MLVNTPLRSFYTASNKSKDVNNYITKELLQASNKLKDVGNYITEELL